MDRIARFMMGNKLCVRVRHEEWTKFQLTWTWFLNCVCCNCFLFRWFSWLCSHIPQSHGTATMAFWSILFLAASGVFTGAKYSQNHSNRVQSITVLLQRSLVQMERLCFLCHQISGCHHQQYSETEDVWGVVVKENCECRGVDCRPWVQGKATEFTYCGEVMEIIG